MNISITTAKLAGQIQSLVGENVYLCYQCKKCTSGCPLAEIMDITPTEIIHSIRLNMKEKVLNSAGIWYCLSCETCSARCPQEIDIAKIMAACRIIAQKEGIQPRLKKAFDFSRTFLENINFFGRVSDISLLSIYKIREDEINKDIKLGMKMLSRGKLKILTPPKNSKICRKIYSRSLELE